MRIINHQSVGIVRVDFPEGVTGMSAHYWTSSCGKIELELSTLEARACSHAGQCDDDVAALRSVPHIAKQLARIDPSALRSYLSEFGAWEDGELDDHDANLSRVLWLAAGDIMENAE